jgi:hypothetical protein
MVREVRRVIYLESGAFAPDYLKRGFVLFQTEPSRNRENLGNRTRPLCVVFAESQAGKAYTQTVVVEMDDILKLRSIRTIGSAWSAIHQRERAARVGSGTRSPPVSGRVR